MKKKLATLVAAPLALVSVLSACSSGNGNSASTASPSQAVSSSPSASASATPAASAKPGEKKKLTVWAGTSFSPEADAILHTRMREWAKYNNVDLNLQIMAGAQFNAKYAAALEAKTMPDVGYIDYTNIGNFIDKNQLLDLNDIIAQAEKANGPFFKAGIDYVKKDNKIFGFPYANSSYVLFYRKDLFAKAGIAGPPKTWEEYRADAKKLNDPAKGIYGSGIVLGKTNDGEQEARNMFWSFDSLFTTPDGKTPTIDNPNTLKAVQMVTDMYLVDKSIPPASTSWDDSGNNKAYLSGQVAMITNPPTVWTALSTADPVVKDNTGVAAMPAGPGGTVKSMGGTYYYGAFSSSKEPDLARKFLYDMFADKEFYKVFHEKVAPVYAPVFQNDAQSDIWKVEVNKAALDTINSYAYQGYPGPSTAAASNVFAKFLITEMWGKILIDKMDPAQAVKQLQAAYEQVYAQK